MREKKDRERFSIKFNENDPAHDAVIRLLEKQGPHSKAQFIVNAVLQYVNGLGVPTISMTQTVDRSSIEKIVMEILSSKDSGHRDTTIETDSIEAIKEEQVSTDLSEQRCDAESEQKKIDEGTWALIVDTMSAFRNS